MAAVNMEHKSCPYCGGRDLKVKNLWRDRLTGEWTYRFVACACKAAGPPVPYDQGEDAAWAAWDHRVEPDPTLF